MRAQCPLDCQGLKEVGVGQSQREQELFRVPLSYHMADFFHGWNMAGNGLLLSSFHHVWNGFMDYMPNSKFLGKVYRIHLLVIVIIVVVVTCKYFQVTKQLPSCFNAEYSLQSENIMAPGTLNREMYFWLCHGNNCLHCFIWIEYLKYHCKNNSPLIGIILSHNGSTGHRTPSLPRYWRR